MTTSEIRKKYIEFFKSKGHIEIPSSSLIPENDPTTLFTGSGMQPMVPYLLGQVHPAGKLLVDSQKCFRSQDIEEVGDNRHTTFFEMLGNWSLGDYFKEKQIPWMFEFLTKELGLDVNRLYFTCFRGNAALGIEKDVVSAELWQNLLKEKEVTSGIQDFSEKDGIKEGMRIFYYDETKNWWSRSGVPQQMPMGEPGGPDSEMFWDFGEQLGRHENSIWKDQSCHVNCDCGRFIEIGNNVFMEYRKTSDGFEKLPQRNVDFGGGLERLAAAVLDNHDIFEIDVFKPFFEQAKKIFAWDYENNDTEKQKTLRIIADHLRAAVFLIGDGVFPSNKDQGYFVRRLLRRAIFRAFELSGDLGRSFHNIGPLIAVFIDIYSEVYPDLKQKSEKIQNTIEEEEMKFRKTLEKGYRQFRVLIARSEKFTGKDAFDLYQSFGFPLELTIEELERSNQMKVSVEEFYTEFKKHQDLSRAGSEQKFSGGLADHSEQVVRGHTATHLLHAALRQVLGEGVAQRGSNITDERLRFDFSYPQKMTPEQLTEVERIVNEQIQKNLSVNFEIMDIDQAKQTGAIGIFEDKYAQLGGKIKVYIVGDEKRGYFSKEICGGPHVSNTGEIKTFKILKEEAVSAGVRRIKAKVG